MSEESVTPKPSRPRKPSKKKAAKKARVKKERAPVNRRRPWHEALSAPINRLVLAPAIHEVVQTETHKGVNIKSAAHLHALFEVHFDCSLARELFDSILLQTGIRFTSGIQLADPLLLKAEKVRSSMEDVALPRQLHPTHFNQPEGDDDVTFTNDSPQDRRREANTAAQLQQRAMAIAQANGEDVEPVIIPR